MWSAAFAPSANWAPHMPWKQVFSQPWRPSLHWCTVPVALEDIMAPAGCWISPEIPLALRLASSSATWGSGWKWWCPRRPHLWTSLILLEVPAQLLTAQTRPTLSGPGELCVTSTRKMHPLGRLLYPQQARRGPQPIAGLSPVPWAWNVDVLWKHIKFSIYFD